MKLLLYGGTFDPPHFGHMSLLQNAIHAVRPDEVTVMVAGIPPHKGASATPAALRLAMCECFRPLFPRVQISDLEIRRKGKSYTWDTIQALQRQNVGADIYVCMGSDMLLSFTQWYKWEEILHAVTLVAQSRSPENGKTLPPAAQALCKLGGRVLLAEGGVKQVSSSEIRAALAAGQSPHGLVPPPADTIAEQNRLYLK